MFATPEPMISVYCLLAARVSVLEDSTWRVPAFSAARL